MKKIPKSIISLVILTVLIFGVLVFLIRHYDQKVEGLQNENTNYQRQIKQLERDNQKKNDIIERQDKEVVSKEEDSIRKQSKKFVDILFSLKPKEAFKDKEKTLEPLLSEDYKKDLFQDTRGKNNMFGKVEVSNVKTFLEEYRPQNETYDVYVQFDEKVQDIDEEKSTTEKTSGKIHFVRKNGKWLIDNFERFTLNRNTSADPK
ncbi:hypothetical protein MTR04_10145 [Staphylococcus agnetis]|uniref:hypothetical protein n=1 Tax=Staphylococcus agnetis TaxID=985762 RepID=UPI00208F657E|nr:hypothetical protein [Staphylococcus agnetis]MCO4360676.1 hypothetical protein [Staphylococcus agnetis]